MNPTYTDLDSFAILGVTCRNAPDKIDFGAEWQRFDRYLELAKPLTADEHYYAGYFMVESEGELVDFYGGVAVPMGAEPPNDELAVRPVPGGRYAVFACTMHTLSQTWAAIYGEWQPPEGVEIDHTRPDLEIFPPERAGEDAAIRVLVPIKSS